MKAVIKMIQETGHRFSLLQRRQSLDLRPVHEGALVVHDGLAYRATWHFNNVMPAIPITPSIAARMITAGTTPIPRKP